MNLLPPIMRKANRQHHRPRRIAATIVGVTALSSLIAAFSLGAAYASSPTSATFSPGSLAANANSTWTVGFTTSSSGALSASNTISVVFNPSFNLAAGQSVTFGSGFAGICPAANDFVNGNVVTVALPAGCSLANSTSGTLSIPGITNPGSGTYSNATFSVATSQDTSAMSGASNIVIGAASSSASSTTVTVSPNPTPPVGPVTITATVSPATATGSVTFFNNGSPITGCTTVGLSSATAKCATNYTSIGNTAYVAVYSGNASLTGSTSDTVVPVAQIETRTAIMLRKGSDFYGKETRQRITVHMSTIAGIPATITGTVNAMAGNQVVCTITLVSNQGHCTLTARELGGHHTYRIYGVYAGSTTYAKSTSDNQLYRIIG